MSETSTHIIVHYHYKISRVYMVHDWDFGEDLESQPKLVGWQWGDFYGWLVASWET
jgi:hypothetical protein